MDQKKRHWASLNEVSFVAGMRLLFWIYRVCGRWPFRLILYPVLFWYVLTQSRARSASTHYLQRLSAYSGSKIASNFLGVLRHFASFAETILDKMLLWGGLYNTQPVEYYGQEQIHQCLLSGRGALIICTHLGNVELSRVLARDYPEIKLTVLVHTKHAQAFNRMMEQLSPHSGLDLLQVSEISAGTAMLLEERIAAGGFVVIAGDRIPVAPHPRVTKVNFLGHTAALPIGPYVLASVLQCPIYLMFSLPIQRVPQVHFELLCETLRLPRKGRDVVISELASRFAARLEHYCALAPLQWFNFYDFWHLPQLEQPHATL
ncbi:MAG: acyltransferase [Undibacterium sp.]|nr:acyltransferase [Undibacterium sp.]